MHPSFRPTRWQTILFSAIAAVLVAGSGIAGDGPQPASKPLPADGRVAPDKADRCPVCAMFPARYPRSAAAMTLKNGATYYFCSNGCLLRTWLRPGAYLGKKRAAIDRMVVLDYFSGRPVDARKATWVAGSDVVGPMGPAIIALGAAGHAAAFNERHGGDIVFALEQLDDNLWRKISRHKLPEP